MSGVTRRRDRRDVSSRNEPMNAATHSPPQLPPEPSSPPLSAAACAAAASPLQCGAPARLPFGETTLRNTKRSHEAADQYGCECECGVRTLQAAECGNTQCKRTTNASACG